MSFVTIDAAAAADTAVRSEFPSPRDVLASEDESLLSPGPPEGVGGCLCRLALASSTSERVVRCIYATPQLLWIVGETATSREVYGKLGDRCQTKSSKRKPA